MFTLLVERYRKALALKPLDVEEAIDRFFHRPVAAVVVAVLLSFPVTPNQVTLGSLATGWLGSFFLYQAFFGAEPGPSVVWLIAGGLLFFAMVLDCADGQLARATGGGTRVGRILDGFVDVLVLVPAYVILGFGIKEMYGLTWFVIAAIAGFSTWIHCIVYDKLKSLYLAHTVPGAGEAHGNESIDEVRLEQRQARKNGSILERFLLWVYVGYLQVQNRLAGGSADADEAAFSAEQIDAYRHKHRMTMHLASYLGLGWHMAFIYGGIALMVVDPRSVLWMQVVFATAFNVLMVVVLWRSRTFDQPVEP